MHIVALIALATSASAIEVTTTPGQLSNQVTDLDITELTVSGEMDARDFHFISTQLHSLTSLNLQDVTIVAYSDENVALVGSVHSFDAATLPQSMLMGLPLESIVLPSSLQAIGYAALAGCERLTALEIPATVTSIGDYALCQTALSQITVPATVAQIGKGAFAHCFELTSASIDAQSVGDYAFLGDAQLTNIQLGSQVRHIGTEAFHGTGVINFDASQTSIDSIGDWAVASTPLQSLALPEQLQHLGEGAFFNTLSLASATIPAGIQQIPAYAFAGGSMMQVDEAFLPDGVTSVGDYAFYNWSQTTNFYLPSSVTYLGTRAMAGMTGLEQIDVTATTVPELGDSVWAGLNHPLINLNTVDNATADLYAAAAQWQDFHIMRDYLLGDVNGDGRVDVQDINLSINYLLGSIPAGFIFEAGDTDGNGGIDVGDINTISNLALSRIAPITFRRAKGTGPDLLSTNDLVSIDAFSVKPGETKTVAIMLDNSQDYAAMQFDITLPAGLEMIGLGKSTSRAAQHLQMMRTDGNRSRILSYSMQNANYANNDDAIFEINIKATDELASDACIEISQVLLVQAQGIAYLAPDSSTPVSSTTGVDNMTIDNSRAYAAGSTLYVEASKSCTMQLVSINGMVRSIDVPAGNSQWNDIAPGIYVVRLQGKSYKLTIQ